MARLLALDWDDHEARYVVASTRGAQLVIDAAGSIPVPTPTDESDARQTLVSALSSDPALRKIGRVRTLVAIDRSQVELLSLTLPPASDAELPDLVRNQAARESNIVTEDTSLDFVPLNDDPTEPRRVAAVALSRERLKEIQAICSAAGIAPDAILMRPYAAAALLAGSSEKPTQVFLLINVFEEEIDLSVVWHDKVLLWRTLRLANVSHDPAAAQKLIAEINRTVIVAGQSLQGQQIETAYLLGGLDEHPALWEQMQTGLSLSVTSVDPFDTVGESAADRPASVGRFSALLGALVVEARGDRHAIDLLDPRKTPTPPDRRRTLTLAGAAAGLLLLLVGYHVWSTLSAVDAENQSLTDELDRLDDEFKLASKRHKVVQAIRDWGESDVNWLDELRDLSLRLPSARDVVLLRMGMSHSRNVGGNIEMTGVVRDPAIVSRIENSVRDKDHQISSRHVQERDQDKSYAWHFEAQLVVTPRTSKGYVSHLPVGESDAPIVKKAPAKTSSTKATER
jgi:hypothetical protein